MRSAADRSRPSGFRAPSRTPESRNSAPRPASITRSFPSGLTRDRVRVVAMDMDSTLITIECIDEIADRAGIKHDVAAITASAMRGEIDFAESLARRVALLAGLPVGELERVYDERLALSPAPSGCWTASRRPARRRCSSPAASRSSPTG